MHLLTACAGITDVALGTDCHETPLLPVRSAATEVKRKSE